MEEYCDDVYKKKRLRRNGLVKVVLLVGFICLIFVNVQENTLSKKDDDHQHELLHEEDQEHDGAPGAADVKMYGQKRSGHRKLDLINIVSKRKVPKGPDPIHNRRAGNSHQPPGRRAA